MPALLRGKSTQGPRTDGTRSLLQPCPRRGQGGSRTPFPDPTRPGSHTTYGRGDQELELLQRHHCQSAWHLLPLCCHTSAMTSPCPCSVAGGSAAALIPPPAAKQSSAAPSQAKHPRHPLAGTSPEAGLLCQPARISITLPLGMESYCKMH